MPSPGATSTRGRVVSGRRAFVAMVLAQDTPYVLLDEPLNNLDQKHSMAMMSHLRRAADEPGRTVVLVVHDIDGTRSAVYARPHDVVTSRRVARSSRRRVEKGPDEPGDQ